MISPVSSQYNLTIKPQYEADVLADIAPLSTYEGLYIYVKDDDQVYFVERDDLDNLIIVPAYEQSSYGIVENDVVIEQYEAASNILGGYIVRLLPNQMIEHADNSDINQIDEVFGMSVNSGTSGSMIRVITSGYMRDVSWSWTPNANIFLTSSGQPSQSYNKPAFAQKVARALSATEILVKISPPIV